MKFIQNLILRNLDLSKVDAELKKKRIAALLSQLTIGSKSAFYEQAEVHNHQNNRNKIVIGSETHIRGRLLLFSCVGSITIGNECYVGLDSRKR